jgi:hypothetical protein
MVMMEKVKEGQKKALKKYSQPAGLESLRRMDAWRLPHA